APPDLLRQIDDARKPFDAGRGEWVRAILTAHLYATNSPLSELHAQSLEELALDLAETRRDIWRALLLTLVHAARLPRDEAVELIRPNLPNPTPPSQHEPQSW
ncbi:MAG: hypothetical protein ACYC6N_13745, partial [Pirellulaceae bacterium]